jgi:hypothetical protein
MIKNTDLETFYNRIDGRIQLIGSYLNNSDKLPKIIKSCRLKPYSIFSDHFQNKVVFEPHWVDEFGNSLKIKNKSFNIILNDTEINKNTKISSDLFFGNSIEVIAKNSKCVLVINFECNQRCYLVSFYGNDGYLRCFFYYKVIAQISPVLLGINTLVDFFENIHNIIKENINKNKMDLLIKLDVLDCIVCWDPVGWQDHIKGDCK